MTFSRWFQRQIEKTATWKNLSDRLQRLEKQMESLQSQKQNREENDSFNGATIIEYLNVEKIVVDRYEQSNNFGALGIKSLEGRLNIGANYGLSEDIPEEKQKSMEEKTKKAAIFYSKKTIQKKQSNKKAPPKTTIRSRSGSA